MSILKTKLKILLVGFIVYQGALMMHKKEKGYELPNMQTAKNSFSFSNPAYANENTGLPLDIPYTPYMGDASSGYGQIQVRARAEADYMVQTGDTSGYQNDLMNDPFARQIMGMK